MWEHVLPAYKTEAEAENPDTAKEVSEVRVDTTTSDNTILVETKEVACPTDGCVPAERLGNSIVENTVTPCDIGADHSLLGVSIYLLVTSDSLSKNSEWTRWKATLPKCKQVAEKLPATAPYSLPPLPLINRTTPA